MPTKSSSSGRGSTGRTVHAAGAVVWQRGPGDTVEVALIHRPRYDDWSLPKGKVDPGETEPVTAVREIFEETGHRVHLGCRIGAVSYPLDQGTKKVRYWAARSTGGEFAPNNEVDELLWLPVSQAVKKVKYSHDRKILRRFAKRPTDTQTVLVVRHADRGQQVALLR